MRGTVPSGRVLDGCRDVARIMELGAEDRLIRSNEMKKKEPPLRVAL
jgi:hypothetical protein